MGEPALSQDPLHSTTDNVAPSAQTPAANTPPVLDEVLPVIHTRALDKTDEGELDTKMQARTPAVYKPPVEDEVHVDTHLPETDSFSEAVVTTSVDNASDVKEVRPEVKEVEDPLATM